MLKSGCSCLLYALPENLTVSRGHIGNALPVPHPGADIAIVYGMAEESSHSPTRNEPALLPTSRPDPPTDPASKPLVPNVQDDAEFPEKGEISTHTSSTLRWNSFSWEMLAFILSTGLLIAIVAILAHYDRQPQPKWDRVSLNSVISWLSTLSKACVIFCISEGLGQLKWVWFVQKVRPMSHLQDFDSASRGIWGSMQLIWSLRAK